MSLGLLSADSGSRSKMLFSAIPAIILLLLLAAWGRWAWIRHASSQSEAPSNPADVDQRVDNDSSEHVNSFGKKHKTHHEPHRHHKHAKSSSSQKTVTSSTRNRDQGGETKPLLPPRAKSQPNPYTDVSEHSSSHDMQFHDGLDSVSNYRSVDANKRGKTQQGQGRPAMRYNHSSQNHDSYFRNPGSQTPENGELTDAFCERLHNHIIDYVKSHPEVAYDFNLDHGKVENGTVASREEVVGKHNRDMALQEARYRKAAFENSKKAFKSGRKAEARQLSEQGKLHDENAKRFNAQAAAEIFASNNPRYYTGRQLSRCDLHGLHVDEAMNYAKEHLIACRNSGTEKTMLIVGKGAHSHQGGPRIRPAILSMLSETGGIVAGVHEKNEGCIVVDFAISR